MLDRTVFSSRDPRFKSPYGAVTAAQEVSFTLRPHLQEDFVRCSLIAWEDFSGQRREISLFPAGIEGDRALFRGVLTAPPAGELVWYLFRLSRRDGETVYLGQDGYGQQHEARAWQLTVYEEAMPMPRWFGRGLTYQIFPDRFCRTSLPDPAGMAGNRIVHENWDELMDYLPDAEGQIRNRDFFGGSLQGVISKLDYLAELGVSTLYFCPIFEADSNHRYNTGDYNRIDPMLGTEEDFTLLCAEAHRRGMRIMLDGVFNHTGSNSRYFNADGFYPTLGAAQSQDSPYYAWYTFRHWPDQYDSWWGIHTLPAVNESNPEYIHYIIEGEDSIVRRWLRLGADAWRLDVADELPDAFIARIRQAMTQEKPDSFLLGEVWEDGSNKIAYSRRRRYLLGRETNGLMNYPFRTAALAFVQGGGGADFMEAMESIRENYPPFAFYSAMNMLGTHDTPRILTLLGADPPEPLESRTQRANYRLSPRELEVGRRRLMMAAILLYAFPGSPTIFYGDEAGMQGFEDPFCRGTFPWGREDAVLLRHFRQLGQLRRSRVSLQDGDIRYLFWEGQGLAFSRSAEGETTLAAFNSGSQPLDMVLPWNRPLATDPLCRQQFSAPAGFVRVTIPPMEGLLLI